MTTVLLLLVGFRVEADVLLLTPKESNVARSIAKEIQQRIITEKVTVLDTLPSNTRHYQLIVTIGTQPLQEYGADITRPHIAAFTSPTVYKRSIDPHHNQTSAVFSLVNPSTLLSSIKDTFGPVTMGYVYSSEDPYLEELIQYAGQHGIDIIPAKATPKTLFKAYRRLFKRKSIDIMLITNDPELYNSRNIRYALEALYRQKIPAVSMSKSLIDAGTTASIYTPYEMVTEKTIDAIESFLVNNELHVAAYGDSRIILDDRMIERYATLIKQLKGRHHDQ